MKKYILTMAFTAAFAVLTTPALFAQPGSNGFGDDPIDAPIDGGATLLVGAGIAYGVKKIRDNRKKAAENTIV